MERLMLSGLWVSTFPADQHSVRSLQYNETFRLQKEIERSLASYCLVSASALVMVGPEMCEGSLRAARSSCVQGTD